MGEEDNGDSSDDEPELGTVPYYSTTELLS